jgi:HEAT repeat protein
MSHSTLPNGAASNEGPPRELPPVEPPSAGFILQLFVIPAVIVAVLIVVVALFGKLAEGSRDASAYVQAIRSTNANVRWRAAYELANLVRNEKNLADDPKLLGELTQTLDDELAKADPDETTLQYLAAALGAFRTINGQPASGRAVDPLTSLAEALAPRRPLAVRAAAAESLARLAAAQGGGVQDERAAAALAKAATDPEPDLRQLAAFALGFFQGEPVVASLRQALQDSDRVVRYNAANALARRGDEAAVPTLREMLTPTQLEDAVRTENAAETQHRVESIHLEALAALEAAAGAGHPELARQLQPEWEALQASQLAGVRMQAESLGKILQRTAPSR